MLNVKEKVVDTEYVHGISRNMSNTLLSRVFRAECGHKYVS